jgi:hypothetical protein
MSNPIAGDVMQSEPSVVKIEQVRSPILGKLFKKMKPLLHRDSSTHSVPGITIDPPVRILHPHVVLPLTPLFPLPRQSSSPSTTSDAAQSSNFLSPDAVAHALPIVDNPSQEKPNYIPDPSTVVVQLPIQPLTQSGHAALRSPSKPVQYAIAPIPPGVSYPDPPGSQHMPTGFFLASPRLDGGNRTPGLALKGRKNASPARLDRPISLFSE